MTKGELDNAIRRALNILDVWNDVTGAVPKRCSLYYELQSIIEDAVHCGAQALRQDYKLLEVEREQTTIEAITPPPTDRAVMEALEEAAKVVRTMEDADRYYAHEFSQYLQARADAIRGEGEKERHG